MMHSGYDVLLAVARHFGPPVFLVGLLIAGFGLVALHDRRREAEHQKFMAEARSRQDLRPCEDWEL